MKTHAHMLGKDSSQFNNPKYVEHKNKLRREGNRFELHKKRMKEDLGYRTEVKLRQYIRESIKRQSANN